MILRCPHCRKPVSLSLIEVPSPSGVLATLEPPSLPKKSKAKICGCGHDMAKHPDGGPCIHGKGTAFGGCDCPGLHSRRRGALWTKTPSSNGDLPLGELKILTAIAQHGAVSSEHLTILTGYKKSSRDAYLRRLQTRGAIARSDGQWVVQDARLLGDFEPLPTGDALLTHYTETLPEGESTILAMVAHAYPKSVRRDDLSEGTGYKKSSRDTYIGRLVTRRLLVKTGDGVRASELLFDKETRMRASELLLDKETC